VAIADVFEDKMASSHNSLTKRHGKEKVDVPPERRYIGFDGYKKAMDNLKAGDIAIFTTPPGFRWVFFEYAVKRGLNVFMEKPVTADGYGTKKILEINKIAKQKKLKVGVGLMCRHSRAHRRRRTGRAAAAALLPHARTGGLGAFVAAEADGPRPRGGALADSALPQFSLGERRAFQRFLHSHHRRVLLDERRATRRPRERQAN
jgi:hypothetical protein